MTTGSPADRPFKALAPARGLAPWLVVLLACGALSAHAADAPAVRSDGLPLSERTQLADPPAATPDFALTDQDGLRFVAGDLHGQTALLFFGFTNCQGVCPATLQVLRQAVRVAGTDTANLRVVLVSVDGERDTPVVLKTYLEPFGPAFMGLTGSPAEVSRVAKDYKAVFFKGMPRPAGGYDVEHTSLVYLVDRQGRLRATFQGAGSEEIASLTRAVMQETQ